VQAEMERQILVHTTYYPAGVETASGTTVGRYAVGSDRITSAGADRVLATVATETRNDKISFIRIGLVRDDTQTATFIAWVARLPNPAATAPASSTPAAPAAPTTTPLTPLTPAAPAGGSTASATLASQLSSGVSGLATLAQSGAATTVTVTLMGLAPGSAHAGHIHRGSCSGAIIFPLAVLTADASGQGTATATVNAPIDAGSWWVQYHSGENPPGPPVACGPVVLASP
jgi:hypothetical protein